VAATISIHSRLGDLLRVRGLSVEDIRERIAVLFERPVDAQALDRLTNNEQVNSVDVETGVAAAAALDVPLDDVLVIEVKTAPIPMEPIPNTGRPAVELLWSTDRWSHDRQPAPVSDASDSAVRKARRPDVDLAPAEGDIAGDRRIGNLFALKSKRPLTANEQSELHVLVSAHAQETYERGVERLAVKRGVPVGQLYGELAEERARVAAWYQALEANPERREALVHEARERRGTRAAD